MGPRVMRRLPKFVHGFIDRHGKPRFYFRRPGFKQLPLSGLPWSPEFMRAYEEALAGQPLLIGSERVKPGTSVGRQTRKVTSTGTSGPQHYSASTSSN
jgi:hypothetical protein